MTNPLKSEFYNKLSEASRTQQRFSICLHFTGHNMEKVQV